jgi:hypothetical protein
MLFLMPETFSPASHLLYKWNPALITVEEMIAGIFGEIRCGGCILLHQLKNRYF